MKEPIAFSELGSEAQQKFFAHARNLIEKEYVTEITVDVLAEKVYNSFIQKRMKPDAPVSEPRSFLSYDKEIQEKTIIKKDKEANWLK